MQALAPPAPKNPDGTFERIGSDEEGHEFLIDLYFDSPEQANGTMADRFPSLDDFAAGKPLLQTHCRLAVTSTICHKAWATLRSGAIS